MARGDRSLRLDAVADRRPGMLAPCRSSSTRSTPSTASRRASPSTRARPCWSSTWRRSAASRRSTPGSSSCSRRYGDRGFSVLGFPCNQFGGQEPGSAEEIATFCSTTYGVTFPMFEKIDVNGPDRHPIYDELTAVADADGHDGDIRWNFEKFLVDAGRHDHPLQPDGGAGRPELVAAIEDALPGLSAPVATVPSTRRLGRLCRRRRRSARPGCAAPRPTTASAPTWAAADVDRPMTVAAADHGARTSSTSSTASRSPTRTAGWRTATPPRCRQWVAAQNAHTREALDARPERAVVARAPRRVDAAARRDGGAGPRRPPVLPRAPGRRRAVRADPPLGRRPRCSRRSCSLDPAAGTADAANAIDWFEASADGALVAVGTSEGGTEDSVLRVLDAADGRDLGEAIPDTRACSVAWEPDGSGFAYTRYPEGDEYHRTVHHHRLGDDWRDDPVVWAEHPDPQAWPDVTMSPDGRWLLVHVLVGWARYDVHLLDRATDDVAHGDRGRRGDVGVRVRRRRRRRSSASRRSTRRGAGSCGCRSARPTRRRGRRSSPRATPCCRTPTVSRRRAARRGDRPRRRHRAPLRRRRHARSASVDGLGDVVAVAGLTADRATRSGLRRRRLVRRADHASGRVGRRHRPSRWFPAAVDGGAVPSLLVQPGRRTRRSTARRSGCS